MKTHPHFQPACRKIGFAVGLLLLPVGAARAVLPSDLKDMVGNRIEAATILGGDFGVSGASFTGFNNSTIDLQKFGGAGDVGDPKPLGTLPIGWQPRLQGELGYLTAKRDFTTVDGLDLTGAQGKIHSFDIQFGGGARFWFNDSFSIAPTIMGMYGHTENTFYPNGNINAENLQPAARAAGLVDWNADTWTIRPAADFQYIYFWGRTLITFSSDPTFFHTESFSTSNPNVSVNGNSETWMNKLDVDIPLNKDFFGHELRTGGFVSRTELMGDVKDGLNNDHIYEAHGRLVLDFLNQLWKVQWIGIGGSYLWGRDFDGYSIGADVAFRF